MRDGLASAVMRRLPHLNDGYAGTRLVKRRRADQSSFKAVFGLTLMMRSKLFLIILLLAAAPLAAEKQWVTRQAARAVIGQPYPTRQDPTSSQHRLGSAAGLAVAGGRLFVADGNRIGATPVNNRVLIFNNVLSMLPEATDEIAQNGTSCPLCGGSADVVLGQPDFTTFDKGLENGMQAAAGVHSDGSVLAVADANNNRVLLWLSIPTTNHTPPDVVLGREDGKPETSAMGMRGPQGVWVAEGKLFVADTQNSRVLIWNSIPTQSGTAPSVVVGQPDFDTRPPADATFFDLEPDANTLFDPAAVTVNNGRMFITDLGANRVLIFFSIPTSNQFPADVVVGQPDFTERLANNRRALCEPLMEGQDDGRNTPDDNPFPPPIDRGDGIDEDGDGIPDLEENRVGLDPMNAADADLDLDGDGLTNLEEFEKGTAINLPDTDFDGIGDAEDDFNDLDFPARCEKTLNFPRFALSDGQRLYISDSGNDRILIFDEIPQENAAAADIVIGQPDFIALTDSLDPGNLRSPISMAWDDATDSLYVADPFSRRILVFSPGEDRIDIDGIVNGAAFAIFAQGDVTWTGATEEGEGNDEGETGQLARLIIAGKNYETRTEVGKANVLRDYFMEQVNNDPLSLVNATPFTGEGFPAVGSIRFGGSVRGGDLLKLIINGRVYELVSVEGDEAFNVIDRYLFMFNQNPDPEVIVTRDPGETALMRITAREVGVDGNLITIAFEAPEDGPLTVDVFDETLINGDEGFGLQLTARTPGRPGNAVTIAATMGGAGMRVNTSGGRITGGSDARFLPPGTLSAMFGEDFSDGEFVAESPDGSLPMELGGVQVYANGIACGLYSVSPTQINFQMPFEIEGEGVFTYIRRTLADGSVIASVPRGNNVPRAAPGLFGLAGPEPRPAVAVHAAGPATGRVAISLPQGGLDTDDDGNTIDGVSTVTITVRDRSYEYTTQVGDTLQEVRDSLVAVINDAQDPEVTAAAIVAGFFSARATVEFGGTPTVGDVVTITIGGRPYSYTAVEGDTAISIRNILVNEINSGRGDPEVTARRLLNFGLIELQVVARELGENTNLITFTVTVSDGAGIQVALDEAVEESGTLQGGQTPPTVELIAREPGKQGNSIPYSATSSDEEEAEDNPDATPADRIIQATALSDHLCCGNVAFSPITDDNPAIPGETIIVFGSGLGLTSPKLEQEGVGPGQPTPPSPPLFAVPFNANDFVSSLVGGRTARVEFAGLMPGFVSVYQINLRINDGLETDPRTPVDIRQVLFISNVVTIPVQRIEDQPTP